MLLMYLINISSKINNFIGEVLQEAAPEYNDLQDARWDVSATAITNQSS